MNRDSLKTAGALILIVAIVGATFWYGNRQRQAQVKHDQEIRNEQDKKSSSQSVATTPPSTASQATPAPAQTPTPVPTPVTGSGTIPETGAELTYLIPVGALVIGYTLKRSSGSALKRSLLSV